MTMKLEATVQGRRNGIILIFLLFFLFFKPSTLLKKETEKGEASPNLAQKDKRGVEEIKRIDKL